MDTLDYIFGPMESWSMSETFGESQPVTERVKTCGTVYQGLPARCTGSSPLGSDFLANSPLRPEARARETSGLAGPGCRPGRGCLAVDGQRMNPVKLAGSLAFGERVEPLSLAVGCENHDELVLGGNAHDEPGMGNLGQRMGEEPHT